MDVTKTQCQQDSRTDVVTIAAISVVTLFLESVSHHGFGHGGAFLVMGARLKRLSSLLVSADATGLAPWQGRVVFAAGSGADVIMALTCLGLLRSGLTLGPHARYFLWLATVMGFLLPAAYLLFTWFPVGDWYTVWSVAGASMAVFVDHCRRRHVRARDAVSGARNGAVPNF